MAYPNAATAKKRRLTKLIAVKSLTSRLEVCLMLVAFHEMDEQFIT